jgi:hypothetical protein
MKFANATKFDRKSGVAEGPAVSLSGTANAPWRIASGFRFSINANCRSATLPRLAGTGRSGRDDKFKGGSPPRQWWRWRDRTSTTATNPVSVCRVRFKAFIELRRSEGRSPANLDNSDCPSRLNELLAEDIGNMNSSTSGRQIAPSVGGYLSPGRLNCKLFGMHNRDCFTRSILDSASSCCTWGADLQEPIPYKDEKPCSGSPCESDHGPSDIRNDISTELAGPLTISLLLGHIDRLDMLAQSERSSTIERLRKATANHTYHVPTEAVASKLIDYMIECGTEVARRP